ncbi:MAG: TIGR00269 family protein [Candidatus Micrarchaeia archaeon]
MSIPKCSACGKPAAIRLAYAARHLCAGCFVKYFEKRFLDTVREYRMIRPREKIAIGLSGGKDSVVLLHLLAKLRKKLPFEIVAITIDEGIAGYRSKTLAVAKQECKKLKIPLKVLSFRKGTGFSLDEIMKKEGNACSWCGVFRRYLLNRGARTEHASKIAIGHNLDDVAQTVLMNMMRNEPARLARFLEPVSEDDAFVPRIRPLMRAPEKEIAAYAMMKGIGIKYSECPYAYQSFRQHVKGQLNETEGEYPGTKIRILKSFLEMEKLMRAGLGKGKTEILKCSRCREPASANLCMACKMMERLGRR